jgi:hypothetical protein
MFPIQALASFELHPRYDVGASPYGEGKVWRAGATRQDGAPTRACLLVFAL